MKRTIAPVFAANCYVLAAGLDESALVINPGASAARGALALLRSHRLTLSVTLFIHSHADYAWDSQTLIKAAHAEGLLIGDDAADVPVYIPERNRYRLEELNITTDISASGMIFTDMAGSEWKQPADIRLLPGDGFSQAIELVPGIALRAISAPGHSEGSTLFFFEVRLIDNALLYEAEAIDDDPAVADEEYSCLMVLNGDVIFKGFVGRTDLPGGDQVQMLATLCFLANAVDPATILLLEHGAVTTIEHGHHGNPYLTKARAREGDLRA